MNPNTPQPTDPSFQAIIRLLMAFHQTDMPADETGLVLKHHSEQVAQQIMDESLSVVERFANNRSSLAKYDLLKYLAAKRQEIRLYR